MELNLELVVPVLMAMMFVVGLVLIWRYPAYEEENWLWNIVPITSGMLLLMLLGASPLWSMLGTMTACTAVMFTRIIRDCWKEFREEDRKCEEAAAAPAKAGEAPAEAGDPVQS